MHNDNLSIWTDITPLENLGVMENTIPTSEIKSYPNPVQNVTHISFKLHEKTKLSLNLYNADGKLIKNLIQDENYDYGKHVIEIDVQKLGLKSGIYLAELNLGSTKKSAKILVE